MTSLDVLLKLKDVIESLCMPNEFVLWGGWARYLLTNASSENRTDVDVIISQKACMNFYDVVLALRKQGFQSYCRIADLNLETHLAKHGVVPDWVRPVVGHGLSWWLMPGPDRLDIIIDPNNFQSIQGYERWVSDASNTTEELLKSMALWKGCDIVFKDPMQTKVGILIPSYESQMKVYEYQLEKSKEQEFIIRGINQDKIKKNIERLKQART